MRTSLSFMSTYECYITVTKEWKMPIVSNIKQIFTIGKSDPVKNVAPNYSWFLLSSDFWSFSSRKKLSAHFVLNFTFQFLLVSLRRPKTEAHFRRTWFGLSDSPSIASVSGCTVATAELIGRPRTWHTEKKSRKLFRYGSANNFWKKCSSPIFIQKA